MQKILVSFVISLSNIELINLDTNSPTIIAETNVDASISFNPTVRHKFINFHNIFSIYL